MGERGRAFRPLPLFESAERAREEACEAAVVRLLDIVKAVPEDTYFCTGGVQSISEDLQSAENNLPDVIIFSCTPNVSLRLRNPTLAHKFLGDALDHAGMCASAKTLAGTSKLDYLALAKSRLGASDPACEALVWTRAVQEASEALVLGGSCGNHAIDSDTPQIYTFSKNSSKNTDHSVLRRTAHLHADARYAGDAAAFFARRFPR